MVNIRERVLRVVEEIEHLSRCIEEIPAQTLIDLDGQYGQQNLQSDKAMLSDGVSFDYDGEVRRICFGAMIGYTDYFLEIPLENIIVELEKVESRKNMKITSIESGSHTPGPWNWDDLTDVVTGPTRCIVATLAPYHRSGDVESTDQQQANARLIAAAPDLLEALADLHDAIRENGLSECLGETFNKATQAIIRARKCP